MAARGRLRITTLLPVFLFLCFSPHCQRTSAPPVSTAKAVLPPRDLDADNLLALIHGAVGTHRTGELSLEASALFALDSDSSTGWSTPPMDPQQTLTIVLPARAIVSQVGLSVPERVDPGFIAKTVAFDSSADGKTFAPLGVMKLAKGGENQLISVTPTEARWIRARIVSEHPVHVLTVFALEARGREIDAYVRPALDGEWTLNGLPARFQTSGTRVRGRVATVPETVIDGAWDGRLIRFTWTRGPQYGPGILVPGADQTSLNGMFWFQDAIPLFFGAAWFGKRTSAEPEMIPEADQSSTFLPRNGRYPLYRFTFGSAGELNEAAEAIARVAGITSATPASRFRLVVHDFHGKDAAACDEASKARLSAIREAMVAARIAPANLEFVAAGSREPKEDIQSPLQRMIYSRVEIQPVK